MLCGHVGPLVAGCVPWQGGATAWILWLGRTPGHAPQLLLLGEASGCAFQWGGSAGWILC